jgi:hypothetical protein
VYSVLDHAVISDCYLVGANQSCSVPNGRFLADCHITNNNSIGCYKIGKLNFWFRAIMGEFPQTGDKAIFTAFCSLNLIADLIQSPADISEVGPDKLSLKSAD